MNIFMQDIEEDPEMRANINLYKDEDVINSLEKQLGGLSLAPTEAIGKSPADAAIDAGKAVVGGQARKVVKAKRSTAESQAENRRQEALRKKDADLFKASIAQRKGAAPADGGDDDSDWEEEVEEDFPHVKLSELLDGLTLEVGGGADDDDEDLEDDAEAEEDGAAAGEFAAPEEEKKQ